MVADFPVHPLRQLIAVVTAIGRDDIFGHGIYRGTPTSEPVDDCRYTVAEALEQPDL
jgi:hypothetical protein